MARAKVFGEHSLCSEDEQRAFLECRFSQLGRLKGVVVYLNAGGSKVAITTATATMMIIIIIAETGPRL